MQDIFDSLKEYLLYDFVTGKFIWVKRRPHAVNVRVGNIAGYINTHPRTHKKYVFINTCGKQIKAHRLAWYFMTGEIPNKIDHINGDGTDNRWCNLRNVTHKENSKNQRRRTDNKFSNVMGVRWSKRSSKWIAGIIHDGKNVHLGLFINFDDAVKARKDAEKFYNFHPNHGSDRSL